MHLVRETEINSASQLGGLGSITFLTPVDDIFESILAVKSHSIRPCLDQQQQQVCQLFIGSC